jgi:hypothetical protein
VLHHEGPCRWPLPGLLIPAITHHHYTTNLFFLIAVWLLLTTTATCAMWRLRRWRCCTQQVGVALCVIKVYNLLFTHS